MRLLLVYFFILVSACSLTSALEPGNETRAGGYCDCVETSFLDLQIPPIERDDVDVIETSGEACEGAPIPGCMESDGGGCATYRIGASADGVCHIVVRFHQHQAFAVDESFVTPAGALCGPQCSRQPVGLDGGTVFVAIQPRVRDGGDASDASDQ